MPPPAPPGGCWVVDVLSGQRPPRTSINLIQVYVARLRAALMDQLHVFDEDSHHRSR
jgi:hypothetical protein